MMLWVLLCVWPRQVSNDDGPKLLKLLGTLLSG